MDSRQMQDEREVYTEMLKLFRNQPNLWDFNHVLYNDKCARNRGYDLLVDVMRKIDTSATQTDVKRKLENMRTALGREWRKCQKKQQQGIPYKPTLWYYDLLSFLKDGEQTFKQEADYEESFNSSTNQSDEVLQPRPSGSFAFISSDEKYDEDFFAEAPRKRLCVEEEYLGDQFDVLDVDINESSAVNSTTFNYTKPPILKKKKGLDEDYHFFLSLLPQMSKFDDLQKMKVKMEIMGIITREVERSTSKT